MFYSNVLKFSKNSLDLTSVGLQPSIGALIISTRFLASEREKFATNRMYDFD